MVKQTNRTMIGVSTLPASDHRARAAAKGSAWAALARELDAWTKAGRVATFWWRDDDAVADTPALRRLLELSRAHRAPLALAVIPAKAGPDLFAALRGHVAVRILQHGYSHANHAAPDAKKSELGAERERETVLAEIAKGRDLLRAAPGEHVLPVLVPPWNRIDAGVATGLRGLGIVGLSTSQARSALRDANGLVRANTHVDPIDWQGGRGFVGEEAALTAAVAHLSARRLGKADPGEPTGLLTHHLVQDAACWRFIDAFLAATAAHRAARWLDAAEVFRPAP